MKIHVTFAAALLGLATLGTLSGCKEKIDESSYSIASKKQIVELLEANPDEYSDILQLFSEVKLGVSDNASTLRSVLSARGNYTVIVPTNEALRKFIKEEFGVSSLDSVPYDRKKVLAYNCIIDNGSSSAYELADFPSNGTTFVLATLDDRRLTSEQKTDNEYYINGDAKVVESNIEASNGMLHVLDGVVFPTTESIAEVIAATPNTRILGQLLKETTWTDSLASQADEEDYYLREWASKIGTTEMPIPSDVNHKVNFMEKRRIRYTGFVETDDVFEKEWGCPTPEYNKLTGNIDNWDAIYSVIKENCERLLGTGNSDCTNADNAVNKFVAYHFIYGGMPLNGIVQHYNEFGYDFGSDAGNPQSNLYSVNVWDYYTTVGPKRALVKVTQVAKGNHEYYLNRISKYDNSFTGNYEELSFTPNSVTNGLNVRIYEKNEYTDEQGNTSVQSGSAINGYIYTIDHILINTEETSRALGSERIRMDFTTMLPEILSNDLRVNGEYRVFPTGYFDNITRESNSTKICYLTGKTGNGVNWSDAQGDEFLVMGVYDFVLKLPPVPVSGYYELRFASQNNSKRSMMQVYLDDKPIPSTPIGLPINQRDIISSPDYPGKPWVSDEDNSNDEQACRESDRNLRNQGYMKGANYYCIGNTRGKTPVRNYNYDNSTAYGAPMRYILRSQYFDKDKTYYLRFKSVLDNEKTEFYIDYFEFCPRSVYDSPDGEDIW